jgi:hypothetical protein
MLQGPELRAKSLGFSDFDGPRLRLKRCMRWILNSRSRTFARSHLHFSDRHPKGQLVFIRDWRVIEHILGVQILHRAHMREFTVVWLLPHHRVNNLARASAEAPLVNV